MFVQQAPSRTFWHFLFDFAIAFFGILAVLFVNDTRIWAVLVGAAMLASIIRCNLARPTATTKKAVQNALAGAAIMLVLMIAAFLQRMPHTTLAGILLAIVALFVLYTAKKT